MKKLSLFITIGLAATIQACHNGAKDSTIKTDSTSVTTADGTRTDSSKTIATPDTGIVNFILAAGGGGIAEIAKSKLAIQQSKNRKVINFANMMITDHTDADNKLTAIAKSKNISPPTGPDTDQQNQISDLSKKKGIDFDKAYVKQMIADHKKTISLFEGARETLKDSIVKSFINATLPTLHKHLTTINSIKK